jgi:NTE family protein
LTTRALVLGGGGVAGIAWETGVLAGLAESGVDVLNADLVIGTSAGSMVAAQVTSGTPLAQLLARQIEPAAQTTELTPTQDIPAVMARFIEVLSGGGDPADLRRRMGELALSTDTVPEEARRAVMVARLPVHEWPQRAVQITAVDTATGDPVVFDRESGVSLVDAVGASCSVPGVWPPVTINGRRYMDGGMRSAENADLAGGYDKVLVLQVIRMPEESPWGGALAGQVAELREAGSAVHVLAADDASVAAFGTNLLDPAVRTPSGLAGLAQGKAEADAVKAFWA